MAPLVRRLASVYHAAGHEDDLRQVAWLGLIKAIDRYEPERGPLRAYAIPTIYGELRRYLRDHSWAIHVPRPLQERVLAVSKTVERLTGNEGRSPSATRVAQELDLPLEDVLEALDAGAAYSTASLDAPAGRQADGRTATLAETVGDNDPAYELADDVVALRGLSHLMDDRERRVLYLRFYEDLTQTQIARQMGCSQMQISRVLRRVLKRLGDHAATQSAA